MSRNLRASQSPRPVGEVRQFVRATVDLVLGSVFPEPWPVVSDPPAGITRCVWLPWTGPAPGGVVVGASEAAARLLGRGFLGLALGGADDGILDDVLREVAAQIGGNLYSLIHGATGLGLPVVVQEPRRWEGALVFSPSPGVQLVTALVGQDRGP